MGSILRPLSALMAFFLFMSPASGGDSVYPGRSWAEKEPSQVGLDAARLAAFSEFAGGRGCVIRRGYLVYSWNDPSRRADVASAAKPFYSHFLFKALEEGKIPELDEKVIRWEPRLRDLNKDLGFKDREITWRHLANQTSCYGLAEKPGTAFCYNDWQMTLFWDTLFLKVYGVTYPTADQAVLRPRLADLIQCQDRPTFMAFGTKDRPGRIAISPRDFARFGLLYLRKGNWRGKQLIGGRFTELAFSSPLPNSIPRAGNKASEMIRGQKSIGSRRIPDNQTDHMGSYSWLWWTNGIDREGRRHWPDAPEDTYGAFGHGGLRAMVVIPGMDLITSWNDTGINSREKENQALKLLVEACRGTVKKEEGK